MNQNDEIERKMREFFGRLASEADEHHIALLNAPAAAKQLMQTERGGRALRAFTRFCLEEGLNLPAADWKALSVLCLASGVPARKPQA